MYNLLVASDVHEWDGRPFILDEDRRVLREFTDPDITERFATLSAVALAELIQLPTLLAYERGLQTDPLFARLRRVSRRDRDVRIDYDVVRLSRFLTWKELHEMGQELGITDWRELGRVHWSVKEVDLHAKLAAKGIVLPAVRQRQLVDIGDHEFAVALSFPGEKRPFVKRLADALEKRLGENNVFYDDFFTAQLARPSLDTLLQDIYGKRSQLVVVLAGADYQRKAWCGLEFRAIKDRIMAREHLKVMILRTDDGDVDGIFDTDGFVDLRRFDADNIADMIQQRVHLLRKARLGGQDSERTPEFQEAGFREAPAATSSTSANLPSYTPTFTSDEWQKPHAPTLLDEALPLKVAVEIVPNIGAGATPGAHIRATNRNAEAVRGAAFKLLDVLLWNENVGRFVETTEIHQNGTFAELETGKDVLFCDQPKDLGFIRAEQGHLRIEGARSGGREYCRMHTPGIWRLVGRVVSADGRGCDAVVCIRWDGTGALKPVECPQTRNT